MKYSVMLARIHDPELDGMTDDQILSRLVDAGLNHEKETIT